MSVLASMPPGTAPATIASASFLPPLDRTLPKMLARQAERYGQRRLVTIGGVTLTYAETAEAAAGYAAALAAAGIKPGDRVAIMCGNRAELLLDDPGLRAGSAPSRFRSIPPRAAHSSSTFSSNCGARLLVIERELTSVLAPLDRARVPLEALWLVGEGPEPGLGAF